ncbi:YqcC family protein [Planctobacterium marinum]|uniref:YqcC-like domain-containing protein n=1 Tax=Planctobacterium marinum TaxID=1631968 RepID=A0AA48KVK9_9ALTE|nr:hypothetical protein MACH26_31460 [Planctobacterium marinum]
MLQELEATLRKFKLWQQNSIAIEQVTSPFGIGQIQFTEWLQFIYLPKMKSLVGAGVGIPKAEITPYAEEVLPSGEGREALLVCIKKLDNLSITAHV